MPRRNRRRSDDSEQARPAPTTSPLGAPAGWTAQRHFGAGAGPDYTCPRCHRGVPRTTEHVVAWLTDSDDRHRHWHTACWTSAVREGLDRYRWG